MNKEKVILKIVLILLVLNLTGAFNETSAETFLIKIAHVAGVNDEDQHACLVFKNFVEPLSQGRIKVEIYPAGQLGNFRQNLEAIAVGSLEMTVTTCGGAANMFPKIQVTDIPYMFPDDRVAEKVYDGWFTQKLREYCLETIPSLRLAFVTNTGGWRCFVTKDKQIRTPSDLKGVRIRTIESPLQVNLVKALGANPTVVSWPEIYTAAKTGIIEGSKNSIVDVMSARLNEVFKYMTLDYHAYMSGFWWINQNLFQSLPPDLKKVVTDGFYHMKWVARSYPKRMSIDYYEEFKKMGGKIYMPTAEEKTEFIQAAEPAKQWYIDKFGKEWVNLLEKAVSEAKVSVDRQNEQEIK
jgi:tripartite ATP-independent transporter DctP family solute receptor